MLNFPKTFDVIVIGGGHAGSEAALAAARWASIPCAKRFLISSRRARHSASWLASSRDTGSRLKLPLNLDFSVILKYPLRLHWIVLVEFDGL